MRRVVLVIGQAGDGFFGNTSGPNGTLYCNVLSSDPSRAGTWALAPGGNAHRIAAPPANGRPTGLAIDPAGRTLYVADSNTSTSGRFPASGGSAPPGLRESRSQAARPRPGAARSCLRTLR